MEEADETNYEETLKLSLAQMESTDAGVGVESGDGEGMQDTRRKWMAIAEWQPESCLAEITTMKGNFWKVTGFNVGAHNYLYPEEALLLCEKRRMLVERGGEIVELPQLYPLVLQTVPLACHLTYMKLKSLDYICRRHGPTVQSFRGDEDLYQYVMAHPSCTLKQALICYNVYPQDGKFIKRDESESTPSAHVCVMEGESSFSCAVTLRLLQEAQGVPVIFATLLPSGHVLMEEFTDATTSLQWKNEPFTFKPLSSKVQGKEDTFAHST